MADTPTLDVRPINAIDFVVIVLALYVVVSISKRVWRRLLVKFGNRDKAA